MDKIIMDTSNPEDLGKKVADEKETRSKFLTVARWAGREKDMLLLFAKFDGMIRQCGNEDKKKDISKIGAIEVYKLLGECFSSLKSNRSLVVPGLDSHRGELYIDGELIYKDK